MPKQNNEKPIKAFEIVFMGVWYYIEIMSEKKVEVYTETPKDTDSEKIENLIHYIKCEGFLSKEYLNS